MHAGDTVTDHQYVTPAADGMHITVSDLTTGHAGTIVLNSKIDGPLMPAYRHAAARQRARVGPRRRRTERPRLGDRAHEPVHLAGEPVLPARERNQAALLLVRHPDLARLPPTDRQGRDVR